MTLSRLLTLAAALPFLAPLHASKEKPVIGLSLDTLKEEPWQKDRDTFIARGLVRALAVWMDVRLSRR